MAGNGTAGPDDVLREDDHARGLQHVVARVTGIERPSQALLRVTLAGDVVAGPIWTRPNVAVRLSLGPEFGEASRVYTVRDAVAGSFALDIVQHGQDSPMMRWGHGLCVGDEVTLAGPRPHPVVPVVGEREAVLFADASAGPAVYEILRAWPAGRRARVWVAIDDEVAVGERAEPAGVRISRVPAHGGALAQVATGITDPSVVVWAAGERDEMTLIRRHFRGLGIAGQEVAVAGYWKRGVSNSRIDEERLRTYRALVAAGGGLADFDDLALEI